MADVTVLDTTQAEGEVIIVLVNGYMVYYEDLFDADSTNCALEAITIADNIATALGVEVETVQVPESHAGKPQAEIVGWFKDRNKPAPLPAKKAAKRKK